MKDQMNLAQMLMQTVTPLSEVQLDRRPYVKKTWKRNTANANDTKRAQAMARYRAVWEQEWERTTVVESRLGFNSGVVLPTLRDWEKAGLIESRERIPGARRAGLEWRWK